VALGVAGASAAGFGCGGSGGLNIAGTFFRRSGIDALEAELASPFAAEFASLLLILLAAELA
jgi:hypothetical protein